MMKKYGALRFVMVFAVVCLGWAIAAAQTGNEEPEEKAGLTDLERRMQKRICIDVNELSIDTVIRQLAEQADLDIIKSPKVTGNVTVTLTDVPLEEALKNILSVHDCTYVLTDNMIIIKTFEEMVAKAEPILTKTYEIVYVDATEVVTALDKFKSPQGSVSSIKGTSHIIVTDTESKIREITELLEKIDRITPQVLVEVRIYDITSRDKLDLGVEWQAGSSTIYNTTSGTGTLGVNPTSGETDPFLTGIFSGATGKTSGTSGVLRFGWLNSGIDIEAMLRAQQNNIDAKLLANPRILVLDNETASMKIISEIPYQELTESATGGTMGTTAFKEVGVELEVTPHLAVGDEMIRLNLKPKFSVRTDEVVIIGTSDNQFPQPVVDRREADTTLLIKHGQTVVLGGLRKKEVTQQTNKIPLLGDLPLLGALFRFEGEDTVISELVVFITPWIVEQPVMSETEQQQFEATEFRGPEPVTTRAERAKK